MIPKRDPPTTNPVLQWRHPAANHFPRWAPLSQAVLPRLQILSQAPLPNQMTRSAARDPRPAVHLEPRSLLPLELRPAQSVRLRQWCQSPTRQSIPVPAVSPHHHSFHSLITEQFQRQLIRPAPATPDRQHSFELDGTQSPPQRGPARSQRPRSPAYRFYPRPQAPLTRRSQTRQWAEKTNPTPLPPPANDRRQLQMTAQAHLQYRPTSQATPLRRRAPERSFAQVPQQVPRQRRGDIPTPLPSPVLEVRRVPHC